LSDFGGAKVLTTLEFSKFRHTKVGAENFLPLLSIDR